MEFVQSKRKIDDVDADGNGSVKKSAVHLNDALAVRCVNTIRVLAADIVDNAKSGHPGAPMGCAPMAHLLWHEFMKYNPQNPKWTNRDRFVLSNGHACALLYSMLHLTGYNVTLNDLKQFRQLNSVTPGHPENFLTPGVEVSTGPLGQGLSNAVGLALAEKHLAARFNKDGLNVVDHYTYVICGDGCLQEGITSEASSLAGHLGLGKLIVLYDDNSITIDGETDLSFTEDVVVRYNSYGWHTQTVADVNDLASLRAAIENAKAETDRPSIIKVRTVIGYGSKKQGTEGVHGAPLGAADVVHVKEFFGFNPTQFFFIPDEVRQVYIKSASDEEEWNLLFDRYSREHPELAAEYNRVFNNELPTDWHKALPVYPPQETGVATRNRSHEVLNAVAKILPEVIGGSADLTPSNLTDLKCSGDFQKNTPEGRYIRFGVREHAMVAVSNGIFAHGGVRPFCATFLTFIGYALGATRVTALSRFGVIFVMTHDSIGLGEDGPTHQPVETLEQLRAMPNIHVLRPADGNETAGAYKIAVESLHTPSVLCLSRQGVPTLEGTDLNKVALGAYVLSDFGTNPSLILVSSGTELSLTVKVAKALHAENVNVRVVSMPSWGHFEAQSIEYQKSVFSDGVPVLSIEASATLGWQKYSHAQYGIDRFGVSAPGGKVYEYFGFTVDNLTKVAREVLSFYQSHKPHSLFDRPRFATVKSHH